MTSGRLLWRAVAGGVFVALAARPARAWVTTDLINLTPAGTQSSDGNFQPAFSGDGRVLGFASYARDLVPADTNDALDIFVHDFVSATTERVSVATDGTQGMGYSFAPALSRDGQQVAFESTAANLAPGSTSGLGAVFLHDRVAGITERLSVESDGSPIAGASFSAAISDDGTVVAFVNATVAPNTNDPRAPSTIIVRDRLTRVTERVGDGFAVALAGAARFVAFASARPDLVPGDSNASTDVFVFDRIERTTERVSVASDGAEGDLDSAAPAISADGRFVAFDSDATNLVPDDTNGALDVFVRDRVNGTTERVSLAADGGQSLASSFAPAISSDGRRVVFVRGTFGGLDVWVHDRTTGTTEPVSVAFDGSDGNGPSFFPAVANDGTRIAFESGASNLLATDASGHLIDVFMAQDLPRPTTTTSTSSTTSTSTSTSTTTTSDTTPTTGVSTTTTSSAFPYPTTTTVGRPVTACHTQDVAGLRCILETELPPSQCAGQRTPRAFRRALKRARMKTVRMATATGGRRARLATQVAEALETASRAVRNAARSTHRKRPLTTACADATLERLADAYAVLVPAASLQIAAADAPAPSGVIQRNLEDVLATAAPTDFIPIFISIEDVHDDSGHQVDFGNVVDGTTAERRVVGIRYQTLVSDHINRPLEHDLIAAGCSRAHAYWIIPSVSASCVPAVIRRVATRAPVRTIGYDGPIIIGGARVSP